MSKFDRKLEKFEFFLSMIVFLIPFILPMTTDNLLESISAYAYSEHNQIYTLLLTIGVILFIVDGIKYDNNLNFLSAFFLLGVILFPDEHFRWLHNGVAACFFTINVFNLIYYSTKKERLISILIGILVFLSFVFVFIIPIFSLYIGESIALLLISGRYLYNKFRLKKRMILNE